jgi:hypothetical protein
MGYPSPTRIGADEGEIELVLVAQITLGITAAPRSSSVLIEAVEQGPQGLFRHRHPRLGDTGVDLANEIGLEPIDRGQALVEIGAPARSCRCGRLEGQQPDVIARKLNWCRFSV